jgi:protocatechuate 3,4-dioxygenase beta subunit
MSGRAGVVLLLLVLAALVAGFLLLGWREAFFEDEGGEGSGEPATGSAPVEGADPRDEASGPERRAPTPTLFGRAREQAKGVGALVARVVRAGETPAPLAGATLTVSGTGFGGEEVAATATSDARGVASVHRLPAGAGYVVALRAAGQPPVEWRDVAVEANGTTDLGDLVVGATGALAGRVVDERGRGVAGAAVRVHPGEASVLEVLGNLVDLVTNLDREPVSLARATTDAEGAFRVEGLPPDRFVVVAVAPGRVRARANVRLGAQGVLGEPPTLVLRSGARVAGRVERPDGTPVGSARVAVMPGGGSDPSAFFYGRTFTETGADGAFALTVPSDSEDLIALAAAEGHPTTISKKFRAGAEDVRIVMAADAVADVTVVTKGTRTPVEGAVVSIATGSEGSGEAGALATGVTGPDGRTTIRTASGPLQMVLVSHPTRPGGMASAAMGGMGAMADALLDADVPKTLEAGATTPIEIRLRDGTAIAGRVTDPAGNALEGVEVRLASFFGGGGRSTRSGADGAYRLEGVSLGFMARFTVRAPGWVLRGEDASIEPGGADGEIAKDLVLRPASRVEGRVVGPDGAPVPGASVRIEGDDVLALAIGAMGGEDPSAVPTDAEGRFALVGVEGTAGSAKRTLSVRAGGFVPGKSEPFAIPEGATVEVPVVRLSRGATVRGSVLDPDGRPVADAKVQASPAREGSLVTGMESLFDAPQETVADSDGRFELAGLPEGKLSLTASGTVHAPGVAKVEVGAAGTTATVELRLRRARTLRVRVLGPDGAPVAGATASAVVEADEDAPVFSMPAMAASGPDGWLSFERQPRVPLRVKAQKDDYVDADAVVPGEADTFELRLGRLSPQDRARVAEIDAEMARLLEAMQGGNASADVSERWRALRAEKQAIEERAKVR